ncbi:MAG: hypothetical protein IPJ85_04505 [Flavobacteriales bacterium]|nr:hypothetical protein [Flavobacteriales bacterium]
MTRIKERHPAVKLLVVSMSDELEVVNRLFVAEVDGYILKNSGKDELSRPSMMCSMIASISNKPCSRAYSRGSGTGERNHRAAEADE